MLRSLLPIVAASFLSMVFVVDDAVRFSTQPIEKGARRVLTATVHNDMTMSFGGEDGEKPDHLDVTQELRCVCEATAVETAGAIAATVAIEKAESRVKEDRSDRTQALDGNGKTYEGSRKDGVWVFTSKPDAEELKQGKGGEHPRGGELEFLQVVAEGALRPAPLAAVLDGKSFKTGEKIAVAADVADKLFMSAALPVKVESLELTLRSVAKSEGRDEARFTVKLIGTPQGGACGVAELTPKMTFDGEATVDVATSVVLNMTLSTTYKTEKKADARDDPTMAGKLTWTFGTALR